ncbi:cystathionine gamma-synthase [Gulosibacter macacae]|uniref:Cystathionine gamma-synthase n=1 Tax=Gulosibacter macacae TaxID=2488791 RepID=A0A3P3W7H4_9MICO|nr:cystathionine gamma-synthase [Gulosibacter macacae]RRJ88613.1 cystathionine gamma-synthase [Gulosibacter macacae]
MTEFNTRAIHDGQTPDPTTGAVIPPLYLTSTFKQDGIGGLREGYEYSRSGNPTRTALQDTLASLEGGTHAFAFASGLAAEDTLLRATLVPGEKILVGNDAYGGTYRLINRVHGEWGITNLTVDFTDLDAVRAAVATHAPRVLWVETPSNPLLRIVDIAAVAEIAQASGAFLVVDNTFATPSLQQPLTLGADVVVHSLTKYLGGHSDVVGGAVIVRDANLAEHIGFLQNAVGAVAAPFDSWLVSRGLKTLGVRIDRHSDNAEAIVAAIEQHPAVEAVLYPGLPSHPGHEIAARQMRRFGGMVSVLLRGGEAAARQLVETTTLFTLAESLGGVESLIEYPAAMTHASVAGTALEVPANLVRISVGIEDARDLVADLTVALDALPA